MQRKKREPGNSSAILKTYAAGATLAELQDKFGIKGKGQLASAVLDALIQVRQNASDSRAAGRRRISPPSSR